MHQIPQGKFRSYEASPPTSATNRKAQALTRATYQLQIEGSNNPLQLRMAITSPGRYRYFWPIGYKSEVHVTPSLGLVNLLEQFTELRETCSLLDLWFIVKRYNPGTVRRKRSIGQGISFSLHVFTTLEVLHILPSWVFMEASLVTID